MFRMWRGAKPGSAVSSVASRGWHPNMRHDLFGEKFHGAQDFLVVEAAHGEVCAEVLYASAL